MSEAKRSISKTVGVPQNGEARPSRLKSRREFGRFFLKQLPVAVAGGVFLASCEGSKNKGGDAGPDAGAGGLSTDTLADMDTNISTDTASTSSACVEFTDQKNEALLKSGDRVVLGKEGFYMEAAEVGFGSENTKVLQVRFFDVEDNQLDINGEIVETDAEKFNANYVLDANNPSLTLNIGSEEQTISLCSIKTMAEGDVAFVTTDYEDGFLKGCEYVDELFEDGSINRTANSMTVQTTVTTYRRTGFATEEGERCEDAQFAQEYVSEQSTFDVSLPEEPVVDPTHVWVKGSRYQLISLDLNAREMELLNGGATKVLNSGDSVRFGELSVMNTGEVDEVTGEPVLSCAYNDRNVADLEFVSLEPLFAKEANVSLFKVTVRDADNEVEKEYLVRYMKGSTGKLSTTVYGFGNVLMLKESELFARGGKEYTLTMDIQAGALNGIALAVVPETA